MKKYVLEFLRRGFLSCGGGPVVMAIIYLTLQKSIGLQTLTVNEVCISIFSITALSFVAGGLTSIYQIERLPLMLAILIHGSVLYVSYLVTYLVNNWLDRGVMPIVTFSMIFILGYIIIWIIIYLINKNKALKLTKMLKQKTKDKELF